MRLLFPLVFIHLAHQGDQETPDDASASLPNILCGEAPKAQGIHISIHQSKASNYYTTIPFLYRSLLFHRSDAEYKCSMFPDIHVLRKKATMQKFLDSTMLYRNSPAPSLSS